jgi:hypothetical protein
VGQGISVLVVLASLFEDLGVELFFALAPRVERPFAASGEHLRIAENHRLRLGNGERLLRQAQPAFDFSRS